MVPDGWRVIEVDDLRFAVPADWLFLQWGQPLCGDQAVSGLVLVRRAGGPDGSCGSSAVPPFPMPAS